MNDIDQSESLANEALDLFQTASYSKPIDELNEIKTTKKISKVFEFLAELYEIQKRYDVSKRLHYILATTK